MERLSLVVEFRHSQSLDGRGIIAHLSNLFFKRQPGNKVFCPFIKRKIGIQVIRVGILGGATVRA